MGRERGRARHCRDDIALGDTPGKMNAGFGRPYGAITAI
jgi:hypothetical protein